MDSQREGSRLTDALRAVAADDGALSASPSVEQQLLAEVRSVARRRRRRAALSTIGAAVVLAVAAAASWTMSRATPSRAAAPPVNQSSVRSGAAMLQATPFLPLPYSGVPMSEGAQLVRLEVPRSALVSFGLAPVDGAPAGASETIFADVLVGEDGLARAVRFVQP